MSNRSKITEALVSLINTNLNGTTYTSNIYGSAESRLRFWDEVTSYPYLSVVASDEYREYQPGHFKWAYLNLIIRIYAKGDAPEVEIEQFLEDIEDLLDRNNDLTYDINEELTSITINSISTSEGVMRPLEISEINIQARYALQGPCPI